MKAKKGVDNMTRSTKNQNGIDQNAFGLPVDTEIIFSDHKDIYKKGVEKRQTKFLQKISFIKPFLKEGEKIILVTTGCSPMSVIELLTMRRSALYLKRSLFVLTNKRIFHVLTKSNYTYKNSIAQILWADCQTIKLEWSTLVIEYKNGKKENFCYIPRKEGQKIKELLKTITLEGVQSKTACRTHLCPRCINELVEDEYTCPNCRLEFKNKEEARRISIIFPGGGYFYTGRPWFGVVDAITESILILFVVLFLSDILIGEQDSFIPLVVVSGLLALEKLISVYHSNLFIKEYIPKETDIKPMI